MKLPKYSEVSESVMGLGLVDYLIRDESETIHELLRLVAQALDFNPRKLRQFLNLLRARTYLYVKLNLFRESLTEEEKSEPDLVTLPRIAKLVALELRHPLLASQLDRTPALFYELLGIRERSNLVAGAPAGSGETPPSPQASPVPHDVSEAVRAADRAVWFEDKVLLDLLRSNDRDDDYNLTGLDYEALVRIREPVMFSPIKKS